VRKLVLVSVVRAVSVTVWEPAEMPEIEPSGIVAEQDVVVAGAAEHVVAEIIAGTPAPSTYTPNV
jgi:hypothetical protein